MPLPVEASLGRDMGVTLFANIYGSIVALLVSLIAARTLSLVDFGRLSWILTTAYLLGALGTCGATLSVIAHRRSADTAAADSFDRASLRLAVVAGCTLAVVLTFVGRTAPQVLGRNLATVAAPAGVLGAVTALVITVSAVLRSRRRFVLSVILSEQLLRTGALIGVVAGWLAGRATVSFVAVTMVTWAVCASVALAAWVHRAWPMGSPAVSLREVAARSMPFFVGSIGTILIPQAGVWTLGAGKAPRTLLFCRLRSGSR